MYKTTVVAKRISSVVLDGHAKGECAFFALQPPKVDAQQNLTFCVSLRALALASKLVTRSDRVSPISEFETITSGQSVTARRSSLSKLLTQAIPDSLYKNDVVPRHGHQSPFSGPRNTDLRNRIMFKLVVLSALLAIAAAKPSFYHDAVAVPAAVSHQSRVDVYSKPLVTAYSAPLVATAPVLASPKVVALPAAVSHQSRVDVIDSHPVVSTKLVAAPEISYVAPSVSYAAPALTYSAPTAVSHQSRVDVINKAVVAGPVYASRYVAPVVSSAYALPAAVSHQARVDYVHKPVYAAYSAPLALGYNTYGW